MKKFLVLASAALVALASCSKTEVTDLAGPQEIGFKMVENNMTKAPVTEDPATEDLGQDISMGVFSLFNGTTNPYFTNIKYTKGDTYWLGDPKQYWPANDKLDFIVYAPYIEDASYTPAENKLSFFAPSDVDALYGKQQYKGWEKKNGNVPVILKHAKSLITVNVKSDVANLYQIKKIVLNNVEQEGNVNVVYEPNLNVTWDFSADPVAGDVEIGNNVLNITNTNTDNPYGDNIMIVPGLQTSFTVSYAMNVNLKGEATYVDCKDVVVDLSTKGFIWEAGKKYIYSLNFKGSEIKLEPSVEVWGTTSNNNQDI